MSFSVLYERINNRVCSVGRNIRDALEPPYEELMELTMNVKTQFIDKINKRHVRVIYTRTYARNR